MKMPDRIWWCKMFGVKTEKFTFIDKRSVQAEYIRKDWLVEQIDILKQEATGASAYEAETALAKVCALLCTTRE